MRSEKNSDWINSPNPGKESATPSCHRHPLHRFPAHHGPVILSIRYQQTNHRKTDRKKKAGVDSAGQPLTVLRQGLSSQSSGRRLHRFHTDPMPLRWRPTVPQTDVSSHHHITPPPHPAPQTKPLSHPTPPPDPQTPSSPPSSHVRRSTTPASSPAPSERDDDLRARPNSASASAELSVAPRPGAAEGMTGYGDEARLRWSRGLELLVLVLPLELA